MSMVGRASNLKQINGGQLSAPTSCRVGILSSPHQVGKDSFVQYLALYGVSDSKGHKSALKSSEILKPLKQVQNDNDGQAHKMLSFASSQRLLSEKRRVECETRGISMGGKGLLLQFPNFTISPTLQDLFSVGKSEVPITGHRSQVTNHPVHMGGMTPLQQEICPFWLESFTGKPQEAKLMESKVSPETVKRSSMSSEKSENGHVELETRGRNVTLSSTLKGLRNPVDKPEVESVRDNGKNIGMSDEATKLSSYQVVNGTKTPPSLEKNEKMEEQKLEQASSASDSELVSVVSGVSGMYKLKSSKVSVATLPSRLGISSSPQFAKDVPASPMAGNVIKSPSVPASGGITSNKNDNPDPELVSGDSGRMPNDGNLRLGFGKFIRNSVDTAFAKEISTSVSRSIVREWDVQPQKSVKDGMLKQVQGGPRAIRDEGGEHKLLEVSPRDILRGKSEESIESDKVIKNFLGHKKASDMPMNRDVLSQDGSDSTESVKLKKPSFVVSDTSKEPNVSFRRNSDSLGARQEAISSRDVWLQGVDKPSETGSRVSSDVMQHQEAIFSRDVRPQVMSDNFATLVHKFKLNIAKGKSEAEILLKPDWLGRLHMKLVVDDKNLIGKIFVDNVVTKALLEASLSELRDALKDAGVEVKDFDIFLFPDYNKQRPRSHEFEHMARWLRPQMESSPTNYNSWVPIGINTGELGRIDYFA